MQSYKVEFLDQPNGGTVLHIDFVDAEDAETAEAHAKIGFANAKARFGARCYQVLESASKRVIALGPGAVLGRT